MESASQRRLAISSQRRNKSTVIHFDKWLGGRQLLAAQSRDIEMWLDDRGPLTGDSRSIYIGALYAFYEWARSAGHCAENPTRPLRCPRRTLAESLAVDISAVGDEERLLTMATLARVYLSERLRRHEIGELTARNARSALEGFARSFGDGAVFELSRQDVELWLETRGRLAPDTRRGQLSTVKGFTAWLARRGFTAVDPSGDVATVSKPRQLPRGLASPQVAALLEVVPDERGILVVLLMLQEGLRCAEVSRLELGDVAFNDRVARVTGKGGHERVLPISDETWDALVRYLNVHPASSGPLVRSYREPWRSLAPDTISGMVSEWMRDAGVKRFSRDRVSAHSCRHTAATDMLRAGAHVRDVQAALGHASITTTQIYLPLVVNDLRSAMGGRRYRS